MHELPMYTSTTTITNERVFLLPCTYVYVSGPNFLFRFSFAKKSGKFVNWLKICGQRSTKSLISKSNLY